MLAKEGRKRTICICLFIPHLSFRPIFVLTSLVLFSCIYDQVRWGLSIQLLFMVWCSPELQLSCGKTGQELFSFLSSEANLSSMIHPPQLISFPQKPVTYWEQSFTYTVPWTMLRPSWKTLSWHGSKPHQGTCQQLTNKEKHEPVLKPFSWPCFIYLVS